MNGTSILMTTTGAGSPLDGSSGGAGDASKVSAFLTLQSLTNFAAMTGALSAAWQALRVYDPRWDTLTVPYTLALIWGAVSLARSWEALKKDNKIVWGNVFAAAFIAFLNSLVLAGAIVGTGTAVGALGGAE